jgi:NADH:ubiquinone oxidoreductase subunit E
MLHIIKVCTGCACDRNFSRDVLKRAEKVFDTKAQAANPDFLNNVIETTKEDTVRLEKTGCMGHCSKAPNIMISSNASPLSMMNLDGEVVNNLLPHRAEKLFKVKKEEWAKKE